MAKVGRKSKYLTNVEPFLDMIPMWRKEGLTEQQVSKKLGIAYSSLSDYKNKNAVLLEALNHGRDLLVSELENSLYRIAMGFGYTETKTLTEKDGSEKIQKIKTEVNERQSLPNVSALIFALKNLDKNHWRDKPFDELVEESAEAKMKEWQRCTSGKVQDGLFDDLIAQEKAQAQEAEE